LFIFINDDTIKNGKIIRLMKNTTYNSLKINIIE